MRQRARVRIENAAATDVLPEKKPAAAPPRADLLDTGMPSGFWDNDDLVIAVPQRAGKSSWQAWESLMRKAADSAPDEGDLRRLDLDNATSWEAFAEANPRASTNLRQHFVGRREQLRGGTR